MIEREDFVVNVWFLAAGAATFIVCLMHIFSGGPQVAKPLLAAKDIDPTAKYLNYYCWHLVSGNLFIMATIFIWPGITTGIHELAIIGTIMAGFYMTWGLLLPKLKRQTYLQMPQGWLFYLS